MTIIYKLRGGASERTGFFYMVHQYCSSDSSSDGKVYVQLHLQSTVGCSLQDRYDKPRHMGDH